MHDVAKNTIIGIFVIMAVSIVMFIVMFLHPTVGDEGKTLLVRFTDIDKIAKGTRVSFAGRPVGEVVKIEEVENAREDQRYRGGDMYIYELTLKIDSGVDVYDTDDISIRTSGLLGERSVEITPKPFKAGYYPRQYTSDEVIFATPSESMEQTLTEFREFLNKADKVVDALTEQLEDLQENDFALNISKTAENLNDITTALNRPTDLNEIVQNIHSITEKADELTDSANELTGRANDLIAKANNSWHKVDATLDDVKIAANNVKSLTFTGNEITDRINYVVGNIQEGRGTVGSLLMNDETSLKLNTLLSKGHILMNDINHYGLLYHLDKGWQRLRARRANLINKLRSPQEFSNFFSDEVDNISSALARVNTVLCETELLCGPYSSVYSKEFSTVFKQLLDEVDGLQENLKLYNQQVEDTRNACLRDACCSECP